MSNPITLGIETDEAGNYQQKLGARERKLLEAIAKDTNTVDTFNQPVITSAVNLKDGVDILLIDATLAALDIVAFSSGKSSYTANVQSVNGTVINTFPATVATGLELTVTDGAADGVLGWEISPGGFLANSDHAYTIGSFAAGAKKDIYFEVKMTCTTATSIEEFTTGFRTGTTPIAEFDDYLDFASLRVDTSQNVNIATILNNTGAANTDTTINIADATQIILRVEVQNNGDARFIVNGTETRVATYKFDDADVIIPFVHFISSTGDPVCIINSLECGYM